MTATDKLRHVLLAAFVAFALFSLCWPGYDLWANSVEPYVLGVPFVFAWVVGWVILTFAVLVLYHLTGSYRPGDEDEG